VEGGSDFWFQLVVTTLYKLLDFRQPSKQTCNGKVKRQNLFTFSESIKYGERCFNHSDGRLKIVR
jgi:hypothetical protein